MLGIYPSRVDRLLLSIGAAVTARGPLKPLRPFFLRQLPPAYLYKFRSLSGQDRDRTRQILLDSKIWFSSPAAFNDPFDCAVEPSFSGREKHIRLHWSRVLVFELERQGYLTLESDFADRANRGEFDPYSEIMRRAQAGQINLSPSQLESNLEAQVQRAKTPVEQARIIAEFQNSVNKLGVLSLAATCTHSLLWSHYGDGHKGVCIQLKAFPTSTSFGSSLLTSAAPVAYATKHPKASFYNPNEREWRTALLLTKAKWWSYEKEWRCVDPSGPGLKDFAPDVLTGVILGCEMPDPDKVEIGQWVASRPQPIPIYEARRVRRQFRLEIVKVP